MLKLHYLGALAAGLTLAACGNAPVSPYSEPHHASNTPYYGSGAYSDYGRVVGIDVVRGEGHTSGGGAVLGGLVGGVLGHQIGSGRGNDAATVAGAVGGAVVGNQLERQRAGADYYHITVRLSDGREATYTQDSLNGIRVGDRVRVGSDRLYLE